MRHRVHYAITAAAGAIALTTSAAPSIAAQTPFGPANPFYAPSSLPFQAPAFDKIQDSDYQPAIEAGMAQQLAEIRVIADSPEPPSFENTVVAL
jgi:peptidyl-dipeptidase Dcp